MKNKLYLLYLHLERSKIVRKKDASAVVSEILSSGSPACTYYLRYLHATASPCGKVHFIAANSVQLSCVCVKIFENFQFQPNGIQ